MPSMMTGSKTNIRVTTKRLSSGVLGEDNEILIDNRQLEYMGTVGRVRKGRSFSSSTETTASSMGEDEDALSMRAPCAIKVENNIGTLDSVLKSMIEHLSEDEKDTAARSSYAYFKDCSRTGGAQKTTDDRDRAAKAMAARHLRADDYDVETAQRHFKATIQWRQDRRLDVLRHCFEETSDEAIAFRQRLQNFIGDKGKLVIQGFDKDHRACWHTVGRHSPDGTQTDHDGCMIAHFYMLERAIACSEARSLKYRSVVQETVIVSVDFQGFEKQHAPLLHTVKDLLFGLRDHYPERLFRVYFVDAPLVFRGLWNIIKPFVDKDTKAKFQFVTGTTQRAIVFTEAMGVDQCMPYQHNNGELSSAIDMDKFYNLPFDVAHGDKCSHNL